MKSGARACRIVGRGIIYTGQYDDNGGPVVLRAVIGQISAQAARFRGGFWKTNRRRNVSAIVGVNPGQLD